jgi:acyl dehydratase
VTQRHLGRFQSRKRDDPRRREDNELDASGEPIAALGVSPGFRELRWLNPVYPGDTITYPTEIVELRPSASRLEWRIMTASNAGTNQRGERCYPSSA